MHTLLEFVVAKTLVTAIALSLEGWLYFGLRCLKPWTAREDVGALGCRREMLAKVGPVSLRWFSI